MRIVFYLGYASLAENNYGSELALVNLVNQLRKHHDVFIFSVNSSDDDIHISPDTYRKSKFDVIIISRYINFYLYFPVNAPKVFVWLHDICLQSAYNGNYLQDYGRWLLDNVYYDKIVAQTEWHSQIFREVYPESKNKLEIIGNGINTDKFKDNEIRVPFSFIYTSSPKRDLNTLLEIFPKIRVMYPKAHLNIFRGPEEFTQEQFQKIESMKEYVFYKGKMDNALLSKEFMKTEMWFYPTDFAETFCISALEAQAGGCVCVCSNKAGLMNVVGNNGILIYSQFETLEFIKECLEGVKKGFENKEFYSQKARESAMKQDWTDRCDMWLKMINN